jgi:hypothetical protein
MGSQLTHRVRALSLSHCVCVCVCGVCVVTDTMVWSEIATKGPLPRYRDVSVSICMNKLVVFGGRYPSLLLPPPTTLVFTMAQRVCPFSLQPWLTIRFLLAAAVTATDRPAGA